LNDNELGGYAAIKKPSKDLGNRARLSVAGSLNGMIENERLENVESTIASRRGISKQNYGEQRMTSILEEVRKREENRMWANAQRDGRPANIGGALCSTPQSLADAHY